MEELFIAPESEHVPLCWQTNSNGLVETVAT